MGHGIRKEEAATNVHLNFYEAAINEADKGVSPRGQNRGIARKKK